MTLFVEVIVVKEQLNILRTLELNSCDAGVTFCDLGMCASLSQILLVKWKDVIMMTLVLHNCVKGYFVFISIKSLIRNNPHE